MAQRLKKKQAVKRPKRVASVKKVAGRRGGKTTALAKAREDLLAPLKGKPEKQFELLGVRCPSGCCLKLQLSTLDSAGVTAGLTILSEVITKNGLPPMEAGPSQARH